MRQKTPRKQAFAGFANSLTTNPHLAGQWHTLYGRQAPLVLELGCGKAEFGLALAAQQPTINYLGIDAKAARLYYGGKEALAQGLTNFKLLREDIYVFSELFAPGEVSRIWITFPDPFPKARHERRRLTAPYFLQQYRTALAPGGVLDFKTDNAELFAYTLQTLAQVGARLLRHTHNLHADSNCLDAETGLFTTYERRFVAEGLPIHYLRCCFD